MLAELSAQQIAERVVRSNALTWSGASSRVRMVVTDAAGKTRERSLEVIGRRKDGDYQSLVRFLAPEDIAGTVYLLLEHGPQESEQYIYTPGLKRTRRIATRERDGAFMGSDFSYADAQGIDTKLATHVRLPDEKVGNEACFVIESTPGPGSQLAYGKLVAWVRQSDFVALRTKFYDRTGKLLKTLYSRRVKTIDGAPTVVEARMQSELAQHATEIFVDSVERHDDLPDAQFRPAALEHM